MNKRPILISILCLVAQGCASHGFASSSEVESVSAQLKEMYDIPQSDLSAGEMADNHLRFFTETPTLLPANQAAIVGREAVERFYYGAYQEIEFISNTYQDLVIDVHGDMATRRWIGTGIFRIAGQPDPVAATHRYLEVLIKEDGKWKILLHSWVPISWE